MTGWGKNPPAERDVLTQRMVAGTGNACQTDDYATPAPARGGREPAAHDLGRGIGRAQTTFAILNQLATRTRDTESPA